MYIYNVTVHVEERIHREWLSWMREKHIAAVLATGKFSKAVLTRVITDEDRGGLSYAVQYTAKSRESLDLYYQEDAPRLREEVIALFGEQVLAFRTELKVIETFENQTE